MTDQQKKELLRDEVIAFLAQRQRLTFDAGQIWRAIGIRLKASQEDIEDALAYRVGELLVNEQFHPAGSTKLYRISVPAGMQYAERHGLA